MAMSLQTKITTFSIALAIIIAISIGSYSYNEYRNSIQTATFSEAESQAEAIEAYLSSWMTDRKSTAATLKARFEKQLSSVGENEKEILSVLQQAQSSLNFGMTFFGLENGHMYRHDPSLNSASYDPRVRGWYKIAKSTGQDYVTAPYISSSTKKLSMTFVEPVQVGGQFKGAIGSLVFLDSILDTLLDLKVVGNGHLIILSRSGKIIAHKDKALILKESTEITPELTKAKMASLNSPVSEFINFEEKGNDKYLYLKPLKNSDWVVGLVLDKATLNTPISSYGFHIVVICLVILVAAFLILMRLVNWLLRDLRRVTATMENIATGNGDLTQRLETTSKDEIAALVNSFNKFVSTLHQTITNVKDIGQNLEAQVQHSHETSSQSAALSDKQQEKIVLVATAVTEMSQATQEIATSVQTTAQEANDSLEASRVGQTQVEKGQNTISSLATDIKGVAEVINELNDNADDINGILTTISNIAEQTNLLALNAAIEAARAGEQGRGFAVVADEVRELSQRTYSSIEEIQKMIETLQRTTKSAVESIERGYQQANNSVADINETKNSLDTILLSVNNINERAIQIASATEEQTSVTKDINDNTEEVSNSSLELVEFAKRSAEQSEEVKHLAEALAKNINHFKT
ncbi:methyl-accepting chemotaxis protein [Marinomonas mediterranea]|uniref:methyl-accepting chemotaxis protein n=1 Tax=Marinomonas mediterranea TaxID=119864 RepID=UPI0023490B8D|nr:methyl-accepting chemotaxis protein [Marinomonas mediterranea]WCN09510.1 HAMP domain-containing protein [Marinomonas mediterranea]